MKLSIFYMFSIDEVTACTRQFIDEMIQESKEKTDDRCESKSLHIIKLQCAISKGIC